MEQSRSSKVQLIAIEVNGAESELVCFIVLFERKLEFPRVVGKFTSVHKIVKDCFLTYDFLKVTQAHPHRFNFFISNQNLCRMCQSNICNL